MICTEKKADGVKNKDWITGAAENYLKLTKVPAWLKNTVWIAEGPYDKDESTIRMYEDSLYVTIALPVGTPFAAGLVEFNVNSRYAVDISDETASPNEYSFSYATGMNKKLWISFMIDTDMKAGRLAFSDAGFGKASFLITKSS